MARETKVGLLVGLAFIICFAIILANHGQRGALLETVPGFALNSADKPRVSVQGIGRPAHQAESIAEGQSPATHAAMRSPPPRMDRDLSINTSPILLHQQGPIAETGLSHAGSDDPSARIRQLEEQISELLAQKSGLHPAAVSAPSSTAGLTLTASPVAPPPPATGPVAPAFRDRVAAPAKRHVIASGDTLTKIAERYYGNRSRRVVSLIVEANQSVIKDPDRIPLGAELVLPADAAVGASASAAEIPQASSVSTPRVEAPRATPKPVGSAPKNEPSRERAAPENRADPIRWYQVCKNDRYVSIARQQLGDAGRWKEIFELNKEKFPKEGMIREGVRIKLPASEGVADSRGKRR